MSDAALAVRDWLRGAGYSASAGGPARRSGVQLVVTKVGGSTSETTEEAQLQIDVWGDRSYAEAASTAQAVKGALVSLSHQSLNPGTFGYGTSGTTDRFLPDPEADRPRFAITTTLTLRHLAGG